MRRDELERKGQTGRKTYVTGMVGNNNTVIATVLPPLAACSRATATSTHPNGTGFKVVPCQDSGCPSAAAWPSM